MMTIEEEKRLRRRNRRQIKKDLGIGFIAQNPRRKNPCNNRDRCNTQLHQDYLESKD